MSPTHENGFHDVCERAELHDRQPKTFEVDDRYVVVVAIGSDIYCIEDMCTHDGGTLGDGEFIDNCLVCPRHGAKFDVRNGHAMCMPATENTPSHEVRVEGGRVLVRLRD